MNEAIKSQCKVPNGSSFLRPGQEFTEEEFSQIEAGVLSPVFSKVNVPE